MKRLLLVLFMLVCSLSALGQLVYPSNRNISTLEKNVLFNALKRFTVTQEGTAKLDSNQLFNGVFVPTYTNSGPSDSDPTVITIENINSAHVQAGAWIGWSTRAWGPTKFKIEVYNTYPSPAPHAPQNTWFTVADVSNYTQQDFIVAIPYSAPGKVRFTFYRGSGTDGRLGISELFLLHPEGAFAYDNFLVKYDNNLNVVLGNSVSTSDSTRGDLAIYANTAPDNRASLKIGYNESNNLEIYRDRTIPDIYFKTNQANTGHMRFVTNNSNFTFNGGKVGIGTNTPNAPLQFGNTEASRKIVLFETANNDHQFYGLGINSFMFRFQLTNTGGSYGFFAATSASTSTELARITGTGRLGIGTSSPNSLLHVSGNSGTANITLSRPNYISSGGIGAIGFATGSNNYLSSITSTFGADTTQASLVFRTGPPNVSPYLLSERMKIDKDGNVGIGGTPNTKLHVIGAGAVQGRIQSSDHAALLSLYGTYGQILSQNDLYLTSSGPTGDLIFQTQAAVRGIVDANGKFGIGQSTATNILDVSTSGGYGNYALIRTSPSAVYQGGLLLSNSATPTTGNSFKMTSSNNGATNGTARFGFIANASTEVFLNSGPAMEFFYDGNVSLAQGSGNVGIGTNSIPSGYKIAIAGSMIAEKVKVKKRVNGAWPDYVFGPDYKLPSLEELELFTKKNSHLPEIPSAREIENEGQDLGEMNRLLLKKVEELTLYLIEQSKEIKALKTKVEQLENK